MPCGPRMIRGMSKQVVNLLCSWSLEVHLQGSICNFIFGTVGDFHESDLKQNGLPRGRLGMVVGRLRKSRALQILVLERALHANARLLERDKLKPIPFPLTADVLELIRELGHGGFNPTLGDAFTLETSRSLRLKLEQPLVWSDQP
jgi:hypothetical protein